MGFVISPFTPGKTYVHFAVGGLTGEKTKKGKSPIGLVESLNELPLMLDGYQRSVPRQNAR